MTRNGNDSANKERRARFEIDRTVTARRCCAARHARPKGMTRNSKRAREAETQLAGSVDLTGWALHERRLLLSSRRWPLDHALQRRITRRSKRMSGDLGGPGCVRPGVVPGRGHADLVGDKPQGLSLLARTPGPRVEGHSSSLEGLAWLPLGCGHCSEPPPSATCHLATVRNFRPPLTR